MKVTVEFELDELVLLLPVKDRQRIHGKLAESLKVEVPETQPSEKELKKCLVCGEEFEPMSKHSILCGKKSCKISYTKSKYKDASERVLEARSLHQIKSEVTENTEKKQTEEIVLQEGQKRCIQCNKPFTPKFSKCKLCGDPKCKKEYMKSYMKNYIDKNPRNVKIAHQRPELPATPRLFPESYDFLELTKAINGEIKSDTPIDFCISCGTIKPENGEWFCKGSSCRNSMIEKLKIARRAWSEGQRGTNSKVLIFVRKNLQIFLKRNESLIQNIQFFKK